jgi:hypothetical protein
MRIYISCMIRNKRVSHSHIPIALCCQPIELTHRPPAFNSSIHTCLYKCIPPTRVCKRVHARTHAHTHTKETQRAPVLLSRPYKFHTLSANTMTSHMATSDTCQDTHSMYPNKSSTHPTHRIHGKRCKFPAFPTSFTSY